MLCARRTFVQTLSCGLAFSGAGLLVPQDVLASDVSLRERVDMLYSNKFTFNHRGQPQITVGLMEGQQQVFLDAPAGMLALPSGEGGTSISGGTRWRIKLTRSQPSRQRFRVVLEAFAATDIRAIDRAVKAWAKKGLQTRECEVGALFGVDGAVLDTRRILLTAGLHPSEADAIAQAKLLRRQHGALGRLHPEIEQRSSGTLVATDLDRGTEIRAQGVLWFSGRGKSGITVRDVVSGSTIGTRSKETRRYHGQIYIAVDRRGKLCVVNLVNESDVLAGLVPAEIFASAPSAALQAQAIAARGQLLAKIGSRHLDDPFLLCSQQHCQVYAGANKEHPRTNRAVQRTLGQVLMRPGADQLVDTVYSANSGGHGEDNEQVWPSHADPQLRGRADGLVAEKFRRGINSSNLHEWIHGLPSSYSRPKTESLRSSYRWTHAIDPASISGNPSIPRGFGLLRAVAVLARGRSGRATSVRLTGSGAQIEIAGELRIRRALGALKSSMFVSAPHPDAYGRLVLYGGGHGHGVGMCQHGAMGMAGAGHSSAKILEHYYFGSKLAKLW